MDTTTTPDADADATNGTPVQPPLRAAFNPLHLLRCAPVIPKAEIRFYLKGLRIEPSPLGGVILVATDGAMMVMVHDINGYCSDPHGVVVRVTPQLLMACRSAVRENGGKNEASADPAKAWTVVDPVALRAQRVVVAGKRLSVVPGFDMNNHDLERFIMPGNAVVGLSKPTQYPSWRLVVPDFKRLQRGSEDIVASKYLGKIAEVSAVGPALRDQARPVVIWSTGLGQVLALQMEHSPETLVVVVPMRDKGLDAERIERLRPFGRAAAGSGAGEVQP